MIDQDSIVYTFEKSYHVSYNQDYFCCVGSSVNLYSFNKGEWISRFKDIKQPNYSRFTSNQNLVVKTTFGKYHIYDLVQMKLIKIIPAPKGVLGSITNFQITSDNRYIIDFSYVFPTYKLMIIDTETGTYTYFNLGFARKGFVFSTECDSKYYIVTSCAETVDASDVSSQEFYELTYVSNKFELKKIFSDRCNKTLMVEYCSNKFAMDDGNRIKFLDLKTRAQDELEYEKNSALYDLKLSKNGRYVALVESQSVYVYDLNNKECVKTYKVENGCYVDFLDENRLLIGTWKKGYCVRF